MILKNLKARITLRGEATPVTFATGGPVPLGYDSGLIDLVDDAGTPANTLWSARITAAANGNVGTLNLATRALTQTTGFPTISGTSGKDFEGVTVAATHLHMVIIKAPRTNTAIVTLASAAGELPDMILNPGQTVAVVMDSAGGYELDLATNNTIAFTIANTGNIVDVHVVAINS